MSNSEQLGKVNSGSNKKYEAKWYPSSGEIYVAYAGWTKVDGRAHNAREAMNMAEAFLRNK